MTDLGSDDYAGAIAAIRDEMRFEVGVFHERVNALISAEAFLLISFTMALSYTSTGWHGRLFWIDPIISVIGFSLSLLACPAINIGYKIIVEWNVLLVDALEKANASSTLVWRRSAIDDQSRSHLDHRRSLLFARWVPVVFMTAWVVLATVVLISS